MMKSNNIQNVTFDFPEIYVNAINPRKLDDKVYKPVPIEKASIARISIFGFGAGDQVWNGLCKASIRAGLKGTHLPKKIYSDVVSMLQKDYSRKPLNQWPNLYFHLGSFRLTLKPEDYIEVQSGISYFAISTFFYSSFR